MKTIARDLVASIVEAILDMIDSLAQLDARIYFAVATVVALVNAAALWVL